MRKIFLLLFLGVGLHSNAQILNDTTVQFVAYWNLNETQTYSVNQTNYKVKGSDTTDIESINYDSELTVIDSIATGYTIRWTYKNYDCKTNNAFTAKLMKMAQAMSVIYTTDELGTFKEVTNFEEIKIFMNRCYDTMAVEFKNIPNIDAVLNQVKQAFSTKDGFQAAAINEIHYFHAPFGGKYSINTIYSGENKLPNIYGGKPLDATVDIDIVEIDTTNSTSMIRFFTVVDSIQAKQATHAYLVQTAKAAKLPEPKIEDIPNINIQSRFASSVHMPSGWVLDAFNAKEVISGDMMKVEETQITLK